MRKLLGCLALSALSAFSESGGGRGAPLRIYTDFRYDPVNGVESSIESELAALVAPIGLNVEWKSLTAPRLGEASLALVVVTFIGRCEVTGLNAGRVVPGSLAWTHISNGEILPFVDIDCDRLRELLQNGLVHFPLKEREHLFGRAVARVLGHELYHVFTGSRHHGKEGVTRPSVSASELLSADFDFGEREFRTLRTSKLQPLLNLPRPAVADTSHIGQAEYKADGCGACHGARGQGSRWAPALRVARSLDPKALMAHFEKKRDEMYRRAHNLKLAWLFPTDQEIADIVAALEIGLE